METHSSALNDSLQSVWKRTQKKHLYAGFLALASWAIPLFLLGIFVDRIAYLPPIGRVVILLVILGFSLYHAWQRGWRHLRGFDPMQCALQIEGQRGELDSLLTTAIQFRDKGASPGTSTSLWEASLQKANESVKSLSASDIVNFAALKRPMRIAFVLLLLIGALAVFNGPFLAAGLARIFTPWSMVSYPTKTRIQSGDRMLVLKEGDAAKIHVELLGDVPKTAKFELVTGQGRPKDIVMDVKDGVATYAIASASRDFRYRIKAGDARSDWHEVKVIPAPRIAEAKVQLQYPEYQQRPTETVEALTLTVPEGTQVKWQLSLDQPIQKAVLHRDGEEPLPLEVSGDGRSLLVEERVTASRGYYFSWVEKNHGFEFNSPRYHMQVSSDEAPRIEFIAPAANLFAMLGRQLDFTVRAQDDHGIGSTTITYRVNLRPEKTVTLATPLRNGEGEQKLDWDYRKEITDLQVGDTVSFIIEIADSYPAPQGPHRVRTDARRITFLSREDYLAQIEAKMDRLLTRVRAIYRQERAAHLLVRSLDATQESFSQTCQLEAIRQEMLREQLKQTSAETRLLLADLAANNITDAANNASLLQLADGMEAIAEKSIAKAAALLRAQAGVGKSNAADLIAADVTVNQAARELAALVMQRGIDAAREVFALETQMLSSEQAALRSRGSALAIAPDDEALERLAKHQAELAAWTAELLEKLQSTMRYDKRPLGVLHLTRRMTELRQNETEAQMKQAAEMIRKREFATAAEVQVASMKALLKAEYSVRTGAEYTAITFARDTLTTLLAEQSKLRTECEALTSDAITDDLTKRQLALRSTLLQMLIPAIPAPRTRLYDEVMPQVPPVDALRATTENAMGDALVLMKAGKRQDAIASLRTAETALAALTDHVATWSIDLSTRTVGLTTLVSTSVKRLSRIKDLETLQIQLLEQCEEAALDEKPTKPLAEAQQRLAEELLLFKKDLLEENKANPDKDTQPIVTRIDAIGKIMANATAALTADKGEDALALQESASDAIALLTEMIQSQSTRLSLLQEIYGFQRDVSNASLTMLDLVNTQNELIQATKDADEEALKKLLPTMNNLVQCITDVAPLFDLVASRLDVGSALLFAGSDIEDAIAATEDGDREDSLDAQEVAAQSLAKVQTLIQSVSEQNGYLAEIMQFCHESLADVALMESGQQQIRLAIEAAPANIPAEISQRQEDLLKTAESFASGLVKTTGMADFNKAAPLMADATRLIKANDATAAIDSMNQSEAALRANGEQLVLVMSVLHGLSKIEVLTTSPPELPELIEIHGLASDQKNIYRTLRFGNNDDLQKIVPRQQKLEARYAKYTQKETPYPLIVSAQQQASQVALATSRDQALVNLSANDESMRHFIIAQSVLLNTVAVPAAASSDPVLTEAESSDLSISEAASLVSDFVSGEAPKDKRSEWETLGTRNRAALNQNFARELPLEYRGMLKDYYEKVAK